jgi:hypothetical protein
MLERLSDPQKTFFFNQTLERKVNNGGFDQYFINTSGGFAHETIRSLQKIGAVTTAEILQLAMNEFPSGVVPKNRAERIGVIKKIAQAASEVWLELDQRFTDTRKI